MNAQVHSKFELSIFDLIKADHDYYDAMIAADHRGEDLSGYCGSAAHPMIMATRCNTLAEIRAKLAWMTEGGTCLVGEEEGFQMMLEDLDALIAQ